MTTNVIPTEFKSGDTFSVRLWETRWPQNELEKEFKADTRSFNRGFRQWAYSDEERTFPHHALLKVVGVTLKDVLINATFFAGVDLSSEKRPGTAIVTIGILPNGRRVIAEIKVGAWSPTEVVNEIGLANMRWKPSILVVENNALQQAVADWAAEKNQAFNIEGFTTGMNKSHPELGLPGLEVELSNKGWMLLMDDPYDTGVPLRDHDAGCLCAYHRFLLEVSEHPFYATTDIVMAWWFAREGVHSGGLQIYAA